MNWLYKPTGNIAGKDLVLYITLSSTNTYYEYTREIPSFTQQLISEPTSLFVQFMGWRVNNKIFPRKN